MTLKIWSKQLLYIKPDPTPYLLAARTPQTVRLMASSTNPLLYTINPQILENTMSNAVVGVQPFNFSFSVNGNFISQGTKYLLEFTGLVVVKSEYSTLAFKFAWNTEWMYIESSVLIPGWNEIAIISTGEKLQLIVNNFVYTLLDTTKVLKSELDFTNYGCTISDNAVTGASSGYIMPKSQDNMNFGNANSWEIGVCFVYNTGATSYNGIFGSTTDYRAPEFNINNSTRSVYLNLSSDGITRNIADTAYVENYTLTVGVKYWTIVYFDGQKYGIKISTDGIHYEDFTVIETSEKVYNTIDPQLIFMNRRVLSGQNVWLKGPLYTDYMGTYIKLDNTYYAKKDIYPNMPTITTGDLNLIQNWSVLKNISAVFL